MRKKIIALFSALAMVITVMCSAFPVAAAGTLVMQTQASKTTIKQGETVTIDLMITENPGLVSIQTLAVYDETAFEMISVTDGALFTDFTYFESATEDKSKAWWTNFGMADNSTKTGKLYSVTFKAKDDIENGDFDFTFDTWEDAVFNYDEEDVPCSIEKATVKVNDGKSDDATLKSLTVSKGTLDPEFSADTEDYTVILPYGSAVPTVSAEANDANATVNIVQATSFNTGENKATVTVTAEKENTKTYTVTFTEINAVLSSLKVNNVSVSGFDPDKTSYTYEVSYADWKEDTAKIYTIDATASKEDSTVAINENDFALTSTSPNSKTDKNVTVTVTPAQGDKTVYTIKFTVLACVHNYVLDSTKSTEPKCTEAGEDVSVCSVCGDEKTEPVNALGHNNDVEWVTVKEAACEEDGSRTKTCDRCGNVIATEVITKTGHDWSAWTNVEGTENYEKTCSKCHETQTKTVLGHTHDFESPDCEIEIIKPATCTETGLRRIWCADPSCAGNIPDDEIDMIDHTREKTTTPATCTESGLEKVVCTVCKNTLSETELSPLGHSFSEAWSTDVLGHWHACTRCGAENEREAHTEDEGTVSGNVKTYSCTICKYVMRIEAASESDNNNNNNNNDNNNNSNSNNNNNNNNNSSNGSINGSAGSSGGGSGVPTVTAPSAVNPTVSMTVKVENVITGKTTTIIAKKNANGVYARLGEENNGCYANIFTTGGEYIYSALIEGGTAKFNIPDNLKIKIVIDSFAYGEDVASAAAVNDKSAVSLPNIMICLISAVLLAGAAVMTVFIKKRANK